MNASMSRRPGLVRGLENDAIVLTRTPDAPEQILILLVGGFDNGAIPQRQAHFAEGVTGQAMQTLQAT